MNDRPASWRMPSPKQMEKLAKQQQRDAAGARSDDCPRSPPLEWWDSVLSDPRASGRPTWIPVHQRQLTEIPRDMLRVECIRCFRIVEISKGDAVRRYGPQAIWKDVGQRLLDDGCKHRTGRHEEDGCWPDWRK